MHHRLSVLVLIAVVAASCSGGAEESEAASSPDSTQPDTPGERQVTVTGDPASTPPAFIVWVEENEGQVIVTVSVPESS